LSYSVHPIFLNNKDMTEEQKDLIYNALIVGMSLDDAYIFAGLTPAQIQAVSDDETLQAEYAKITKQHEYGLLTKLSDVIDKQRNMGREGAVTWALEHLYPQRYANKNQGDGKTVNIVLDGHKDPAADTEVVEMHV